MVLAPPLAMRMPILSEAVLWLLAALTSAMVRMAVSLPLLVMNFQEPRAA
jgi:hypothetical protein